MLERISTRRAAGRKGVTRILRSECDDEVLEQGGGALGGRGAGLHAAVRSARHRQQPHDDADANGVRRATHSLSFNGGGAQMKVGLSIATER